MLKRIKLLFRQVFRVVVTIVLFITILPLLGMQLLDWVLTTDRGARLLFWRSHPNIKVRYTDTGIRYITIGDENKQPLMLIHGAMISLLTWIRLTRFKELYQKYYLIIPERPGYGASLPKSVIHSIDTQASLLISILKKTNKKTVVVGHSYGGPISMMMGHQYPEGIDFIVGVAGQFDPDHEIQYLVSPFFALKALRFVLPRIIWAANQEKIHHIQALKDIAEKYHEIKVPVNLIHGDEDGLVPLENSYTLQAILGKDTPLKILQGKDHPIPIEAPKELLQLLI